MTPDVIPPPFDRFLTAGEAVLQDRPDADPEMVREIFLEVASTLYNGLALDGLDEHDAAAVVDGLCAALTAGDPSVAVRAQAESALTDTSLHDRETASGAYLFSASILQL